MNAACAFRPLRRLASRSRRAYFQRPSCFSTAAPNGPVIPAVSSNNTLRNVLGVSVATGLLGVGAYVATSTSSQPFELPEITDAIFSESDNLAVVVISSQPSLIVQQRITELRDFLQSTPALRHIRLFHTKEKPTGLEQAEGDEVKIMVYKGHRKEQKSFTALPKDFIEQFFVPRSEDPYPLRTDSGPQNIASAQFEELVIKSSYERPVLVQAYEDTCFMCFLMRPFIECFARCEEAPFQIRRLNIELNDFPQGFPITRATPTFILFRDGKAEKWEEFKPNDIVAKLDAMPVAASVKERLHSLIPKVQERFQLFTACVMMQLDMDKMQQKAAKMDGEEEDKVAFEEAVTKLMAADMQRTDGLEENLKYLKSELSSLEEDVAVLADMLHVEIPSVARFRKVEADIKSQTHTEEAPADTSATESATHSKDTLLANE